MFAPPAGTGNGTAAIVCPGGGYDCLAVDKEGAEATRWLSSLGVTALLLKYRVAPHRHPAPLTDVLQAVRLVRSRARELGVEPDRIGIVGASAGGHLAASAATMFDARDGKTGASLDAVSARPDFVVLLYPVITMAEPHAHGGSRRALLGDRPPAELVARLSLEGAVTRGDVAGVHHAHRGGRVGADRELDPVLSRAARGRRARRDAPLRKRRARLRLAGRARADVGVAAPLRGVDAVSRLAAGRRRRRRRGDGDPSDVSTNNIK